MPTLQEIRAKYPQYNDLGDQDFVDRFHGKFYADLPKEDFYNRVGYKPTQSQTASSSKSDPYNKTWSWQLSDEEKAILSKDIIKSRNENSKAIVRGAVKGATGLVTVPADLTYMGLNYLTGQNIESPFGPNVERALTRVVGKPETSSGRITEDIIAGATGGVALRLPGAALSGATAGASSGAAREAGMGPVGQLVAGVAGGFAPSVISGAAQSIKNVVAPKDASASLTNIVPDEQLDKVVGVMRKRYGTMEAAENRMWEIAKEQGKKQTVNGDFAASIPARIESTLADDAKSLADADMAPLARIVSKFSEYGASDKASKILDASGKPISESVIKNIPASELIALRKQVSKLVKTSSDGNLRYAARKTVDTLDNAIEELALSGDAGGEVAKSFISAIRTSREKFSRFGTNKFQKKAFEKIVTNPEANATDVAAVLGTTQKITPQSEEFILRSIKESGANAQNVKNAYAEYFWQKAVSKAMQNRNGQMIVQPNILGKEIDKIISAQTTTGGLSKSVRDSVFDQADLDTLLSIKDNLPKEGMIARAGKEAFSIIRRSERLRTSSEQSSIETLNMIAPILDNGIKGAEKIFKNKQSTASKVIPGVLAGGQSE